MSEIPAFMETIKYDASILNWSPDLGHTRCLLRSSHLLVLRRLRFYPQLSYGVAGETKTPLLDEFAGLKLGAARTAVVGVTPSTLAGKFATNARTEAKAPGSELKARWTHPRRTTCPYRR